MAPIHTLNSGSTVAENFQGRGYKLDSTRERELESERNELLIKTEFFANKCSDFRNAKVLAETRSDGLEKELKSKNEKILRLRKELNRTSDAKIQNDSNIKQFKEGIKQLKEEIKQLQSKNTNLVSHYSLKELSLTGYQTKYYKKMEEATYLQSRIKLLEEKLFSAQNDSSLIKSEFLSLKSKLAELDQTKDELVQTKDELVQTKDELSLKIDEVERLKLEAISQSLHDQIKFPSDKTIAGGYEPQENVSKVSNIPVDNKSSLDTKYPAPEKSLRKYLRENIKMQLRKPEVSATSPEIKIVDTNSPDKDKSGTSSFKDDTLQNIKPIKIDVPSGNIPNSSLDKSNSGISVGGTEAIPAMTSVLGLPKTVWLLLVLFIIIVVWVRSIWKAKKKNENRDHTNTFLFN
ncbi:18000_t:CDS:1 [Entrophospora sp. SA101]|nr:18000_t:CDS:1 [Entrophospora sp. SA101]